MKDSILKVSFMASELAHTHPLTTPLPLCFSFQTSSLQTCNNPHSTPSSIHFDVLEHDSCVANSSSIIIPCELLDDVVDGGGGGGDHSIMRDSYMKLYMATFRSKRRDFADTKLLCMVDADAKQEADQRGGLLLVYLICNHYYVNELCSIEVNIGGGLDCI